MARQVRWRLTTLMASSMFRSRRSAISSTAGSVESAGRSMGIFQYEASQDRPVAAAGIVTAAEQCQGFAALMPALEICDQAYLAIHFGDIVANESVPLNLLRGRVEFRARRERPERPQERCRWREVPKPTVEPCSSNAPRPVPHDKEPRPILGVRLHSAVLCGDDGHAISIACISRIPPRKSQVLSCYFNDLI